MTSDKHGKTGSARMRPRARLISVIGDELISDEPVALVELVKNAYDADASRATISFTGGNPLDPDTVTIADDGSGMDLDTVLRGWFEPGTILKKRAERSPGGRLYQGSKGVGRFAAARLADSLYMETKRQGEDEGVTVLLDWGRFTDDSYLDEVEIDYDVRPLPDMAHGTLLTLMNLHTRKHWEAGDFKVLHDRLSRLISPFQSDFEKIGDFSIELDVPGYPEFTGHVEPHELTRDPMYRLIGGLSPTGSFTGSLEIDGKKAKSFDGRQLGSPTDEVDCGPFAVEVRAWDRDRPGLTPYMLKYDQSLSRVRAILDAYCGVSVYRDGFRVHPYGEAGDDWLQLDARSRQTPVRCLANNQVIAAIRISREGNPEIKDRTTREGVVHNEQYRALQEWFKRILALLEEERYRIRPREDAKPEYATTIFEAFDMTEVVRATDEQLGRRHPVSKLVRQKDGEIREGVKRLQEHYSRVLLAAGLGQLVDIVIHEIGAPLGRINRELKQLEKELKGVPATDQQERIDSSLTHIRGWLEQIHNLRARLDPKTAGKRGRATTFTVQEEIIGNLLLYESLIQRQDIEVSLRAPKQPLAVHMSRSNLGQIIANLLDNSIYWLTRHHGDGKGGRIDIHVTTLKHGFRIRFSDDGPGVPEEDQGLIFDQYFSRKSNGMGLGLYIGRQVIEPYGRLILRDDGKLPGACFEATFERRVGL